MRVMVLIKASRASEAGEMPGTDLLTAMGEYNEQLVKAGVLLAGEGLLPSRHGVRVTFDQGKKTVVDGPFAETKELLAGFWLWQVKTLDEAVEWVKRMPQVPGNEQAVEVRRVAEAEDFGEAFTPELREKEEKLREETERRG